MRRPKRLTTGLALSAAAALLLTACGDNGGDNGTPSPSDGSSSSATSTATPSDGDNSSSSTTASPTESATPEPATSTSAAKNIPAPEMPEAMKTNDQAGLEAALEYWYDAFHYLKLTGEATPVQLGSSVDCGFCNELITDWSRVYEAGGWAVVEQNEINIDLATLEDDEFGTFLYRDTQAPVHVYQPDGTKAEQASSDNTDTVYWSASASFDSDLGHWTIDSLSTEGQTEE